MKKIVVVAILLSIISCSGGSEQEINCDISNIEINTSVFSEQLNAGQYEITNIVELQLPKDKFITQVSKMMLYDNKIYIFDKEYAKTLYVFDSMGNYQYNLGEIGKSSSEFYRQPTDFYIDKKNGDTYIFEKESRKIIIFDKKGEYKSFIEFKEYWPFAFALLENNNFAFAFRNKNNYLSDNYELVISNASESSISNYRKLKNNHQVTIEMPFSSSDNELFFIPNQCDTIFSIKNDTIHRAIAVDFGKSKMPDNIRNELKSGGDYSTIKDLECVKSIERYIENSHWINIEYNYSSIKVNYLKNKMNGKEYNFVSLFHGLMTSNLGYIENESLIFIMTAEDIDRWLEFKKENESVWNDLYNLSDDKIKKIIQENNQTCVLIYVTLKSN